MENWVSSLDMLAASGVIDFDAAAFLLDQKPRYIGNPDMERLPMESPEYLPHGTKLKDVPDKDLFEKSENGDLVENPKWKKLLFGAVAIAGVIGAALFGGKTVKAVKSIKMPKLSIPKFSGAKNFLSKIWSGIKKPFNWVAAKIKKP